jgi:hypothetical protein
MQKQLTLFKSVINGIENYFHFDANCPVDIAKDALLECLKWIGQIEDAAKAAQEMQAKAEAEANQAEAPAEAPAETPSQETPHE